MIGFLIVDKEAGWTSHDVVARCRSILGERRIGHAGTLDPGATGVLVLGVGRATRLLRYVSGVDKEYRGEVVLGATTSTLDDDGEITERFDMSAVTIADVGAAAARLTGEIDQLVPMVSAVKVRGRRLHRLAREGADVERPVRRIRIDRLDVGAGIDPGTFTIDVQCSSGTYVRVLAADLGTALGGGAHLRRLRRTRVGPFTESEARPLDEIAASVAAGDTSVLRAPLEGLDLARVTVSGELAAAVAYGRPIDAATLGAPGAGPVALVDADGELLAVYRCGEGGPARPEVVLRPA